MTGKVGRKPGTPKTGGRQKGAVNKVTKEAMDLAAELGINPFEILLHYCARDWKALGYTSANIEKTTRDGVPYTEERITAEMQMTAAKEASQYLLPKRKAIEHSGELNVTHLSDQELIAIVKAYYQDK